MKCENCYVSANSNQTPNVINWGTNNLICYGSCNSVLVYDSNIGGGGKITYTLVGHSKRVNSVKWLRGKDTLHESEIVSGSTDSSVIIWTLKNGSYESQTLKGHNSNVNIVDGIYRGTDRTDAFIASVSMDCTVKIWYRARVSDNFELIQDINLGYNIAVALKISFLPNDSNLILSYGLDTSKIQIYTQNDTSNPKASFSYCTQLIGHQDWVRGLDFTTYGDDLLLASSSQDCYIRLWRFSQKDLINEDIDKIENKRTQIQINNKIYNVYLDSVLAGHEGWIYSVNWSPTCLQLLSASIDKSMIIWEFDDKSGLWMEKVRVGEVGGNTLGFYAGVFGPDGKHIFANSYHGAFHIWKYCEELGVWNPSITVGGHFSEVVDCAWEPKGEFVFSISSDQTTRIHAPWPTKKQPVTWHELARPQVHGYDMNCLAVLSRYKFASGAEEKVIRTFEAPANFVENFKRICQISEDGEKLELKNSYNHNEPKGASVPSLGLSNKAVYTNDNTDRATAVDKRNPYPEESHFVATDFIEPPTEETLIQNTLWPEIQKLYGHGYEVFALAASPDGKFLASACKSTKPEHAAVLLWETSNWQLIQKLMSHTLTVVQIQFSPDSKYLLSVSRDRRWSLFSRNDQELFDLVATTDKKTGIHTRIIWTCSWSYDSKYFATGSRDGKVVVWTINKGKERTGILGECEAVSTVELKNESVTAVAFAPVLVAASYMIAAGLESGVIHLYLWNPEEWKEVLVLSQSYAHHLTIRRLSFRPVLGKAGYKDQDNNILQLASCSADHSLKIHNLFLNSLV